jgi:hypothetical protein
MLICEDKEVCVQSTGMGQLTTDTRSQPHSPFG